MSAEKIIDRCLTKAQAELEKITCYDKKPKIILAYRGYEYLNGEFIQESYGDRGHVYRSVIAHTEDEFVESLIYEAIKAFAFSYELTHRRKFEDNRRQVNEIITRCYDCLTSDYQYTLLGNLKDNIHIYFDLLDYYVKISRAYLEKHNVPLSVEAEINFIATKAYANRMGGIYDVAFSYDWVRYHISKIVSSIKELEAVYYLHDEHYQRLCVLEKKDAADKEKYQLGSWDDSIFEKAENILKHNIVREENALKCAVYMLINRIHTKRDVVSDIDELILLSKIVDISCFKMPLEELFVTDKYGIFSREPYSDYKEYARDSLDIRSS